MKARCSDPRHRSYQYYGARGIKICAEWQDFSAFFMWAQETGYFHGLTIDRIDSAGDYEPSNCQWLTMREQNRKHKHCRPLTYNGKTQLAIDWARELSMNICTLYWRLDHGYTVEQALTMPRGAKR
jgi:hypothetical protein